VLLAYPSPGYLLISSGSFILFCKLFLRVLFIFGCCGRLVAFIWDGISKVFGMRNDTHLPRILVVCDESLS